MNTQNSNGNMSNIGREKMLAKALVERMDHLAYLDIEKAKPALAKAVKPIDEELAHIVIETKDGVRTAKNRVTGETVDPERVKFLAAERVRVKDDLRKSIEAEQAEVLAEAKEIAAKLVDGGIDDLPRLRRLAGRAKGFLMGKRPERHEAEVPSDSAE